MAEYIERDRFIHYLEMCIDNVRNTNGVTEDFEICLRALKNQPTADVAKVKHGEWVLNKSKTTGSTEAKCSVCGRDCVYQIINGVYEFENYCPHCGAKMDKE